MLATHFDAEKRYSELRKQALSATMSVLDNKITLSEINSNALSATRLWNKSQIRIKDWDWFEGYSCFKFRYPKRFEMALWHSNKLIGITMGRPTFYGSAMRLDIIEASPSDLGDRPSIFESVLVAYGIYARLINAKQIRIMNPVNDAVKSYYESFGYKYIVKGDYLFKDIY
jgi:hypothetical protein